MRCKVIGVLSMGCESLLVHWDLEQLSACHKGMELAQDFLIECGAAVCDLSASDPRDQRFDFLCKYSALVRHRVSCLECKNARIKPQSRRLLAL